MCFGAGLVFHPRRDGDAAMGADERLRSQAVNGSQRQSIYDVPLRSP